MKSQAYRMALLFDFYGDLLTERQKEFYDLYYNEDLSLAEIAENYNISRQGVRDVIVRGEAYLSEVEEKTGLIARFHETQAQIAAVKASADALRKHIDINDRKYNDYDLEVAVSRLGEMVDHLAGE